MQGVIKRFVILMVVVVLVAGDAETKKREGTGHGQMVNNLRRVFKRSSKSSAIAFHAYLSSSKGNLQSGHILKFNMITTNRGHSYHGHTGVFIAPRSGLYQFTWTAVVYASRHLYLCLKVNGVCKAWTYSNAPRGGIEPQTGSMIVELRRKDHVSVVNTSNGGYVQGTYTSFSGLWLGP